MAGAKPSFSAQDVLLTFLLITDKHSRASLSEEVGVGEGAMRSILARLKERGLVEGSAQGHGYSKKGQDLREMFEGIFSLPERVCTQFFQDMVQAASVVEDRQGAITWMARDIAIANGAKAALILKKKSTLKAQGIDEDFSGLEDQLTISEGKTVIVAAAQRLQDARKAVLAVIIDLIKEVGIVSEQINQ